MPPDHSHPPTNSSSPGGGGARQSDGRGQTPNTPHSGPPPLPTPTAPNHFHSVLLLGEDHTELGEITIRDVTPNLVIGISRGRFPKGYAHVDPNEDAVFAATDGTTTILAAADGHHGFDAARAVMAAIANATPGALDAPLEAAIRRLTAAAIDAVADIASTLSPPRDTSRTSLTIAAIRDHTVAAATIGDTPGFVATRRRLKRLGSDTEFLSAGSDPASVEIVGTRISDRAAVVLTTDGYFDFAANPRATLRSVPHLAAPDAAKVLISEGFSGGAGDNIAVAVYQQP